MASHAADPWRRFPLWLGLAMAAVFAVNGLMVYTAVVSFPGEAGTDGFDLGNRYDAVLAADAAQRSLGWSVQAAAEAGRPVIRLAAPAGPLAGAVLTGSAERPVGPREMRVLDFRETAPGRYEAASPLPGAGQWDLRLHVRHQEHDMLLTRRLVVR
jgi:nitrogen fixation protein FixH